METRFESQIEEVLMATKKLVSYTLYITTAEASDAILARLF
jgi:hypothetical protein